jgi:hypothetical protein
LIELWFPFLIKWNSKLLSKLFMTSIAQDDIKLVTQRSQTLFQCTGH